MCYFAFGLSTAVDRRTCTGPYMALQNLWSRSPKTTRFVELLGRSSAITSGRVYSSTLFMLSIRIRWILVQPEPGLYCSQNA